MAAAATRRTTAPPWPSAAAPRPAPPAPVIGATYELLDHPDGGLLPTLEARHTLIRLIRGFRPDLVLTHRPNDYHPDHRYTSVLVQDSAYLLTVPAVCPDAPHLERDPVILYFSDDFKKPAPFHPDVVVDIGDELSRVVDMLHCHVSQFYEWLPYNGGHAGEVPADAASRRAWLEERYRRRLRPLADLFRDLLDAPTANCRGGGRSTSRRSRRRSMAPRLTGRRGRGCFRSCRARRKSSRTT